MNSGLCKTWWSCSPAGFENDPKSILCFNGSRTSDLSVTEKCHKFLTFDQLPRNRAKAQTFVNHLLSWHSFSFFLNCKTYFKNYIRLQNPETFRNTSYITFRHPTLLGATDTRTWLHSSAPVMWRDSSTAGFLSGCVSTHHRLHLPHRLIRASSQPQLHESTSPETLFPIQLHDHT